jgi:hypothetical protein
LSHEEILSTINFDNLLKLGYAVIDARYCDYEITDNGYKFVIVRVEGDRDNFYLEMMKSYLPSYQPGKDIYEVWSKVLAHKIAMSEILKRDISIKVAFHDFWEINNY